MSKTKGTIKAFKGKLEDGEQDQIHLSGGKSGTGYRIVKFQVITVAPFTESEEHISKIYKVPQDAIDGVVNFNDGTLLAVAIINSHSSGYSSPSIPAIVFDREIVNQDLYITHSDVQSNKGINYYIELEEVKMTGPQEAVVNYSAVILNTN